MLAFVSLPDLRLDRGPAWADEGAPSFLAFVAQPNLRLDRGPDFALLLEAAEASDALHELVHVTLPAALNP